MIIPLLSVNIFQDLTPLLTSPRREFMRGEEDFLNIWRENFLPEVKF